MGQGPVPTGSPRPFMSFSLLSGRLKDKLIVGFSLMSVIPLLVLVYLVTTYIFPSTQQMGVISLTVMLAIGISLLGLAVTRSFVMPMAKLASQAQAIAHGELDRQVEIGSRDEVGAIGSALNQIMLLVRRADQLKVIDELTGLYNAGYMKNRLVEEVSRAIRYHRPCSLVLLDIGPLAAEGVLYQVAELLKGRVTDLDRAGRMGPDQFAIILPEQNKREAIELAEIIRTQVEQHLFSNGPDLLTCPFHLCAVVSENPLDGSTAEELFSKAEAAMRSAKQQGKNKVIAA